jgi:hypothetical protein
VETFLTAKLFTDCCALMLSGAHCTTRMLAKQPFLTGMVTVLQALGRLSLVISVQALTFVAPGVAISTAARHDAATEGITKM